MHISINTARSIVGSFVVNVKQHPEYLSKDGTYCERNYKVGLALEAINELQKHLNG